MATKQPDSSTSNQQIFGASAAAFLCAGVLVFAATLQWGMKTQYSGHPACFYYFSLGLVFFLVGCGMAIPACPTKLGTCALVLSVLGFVVGGLLTLYYAALCMAFPG